MRKNYRQIQGDNVIRATFEDISNDLLRYQNIFRRRSKREHDSLCTLHLANRLVDLVAELANRATRSTQNHLEPAPTRLKYPDELGDRFLTEILTNVLINHPSPGSIAF